MIMNLPIKDETLKKFIRLNRENTTSLTILCCGIEDKQKQNVSITIIGSECFKNDNTLHIVKIPNTVKCIEENAFENMSELQIVEFIDCKPDGSSGQPDGSSGQSQMA